MLGGSIDVIVFLGLEKGSYFFEDLEECLVGGFCLRFLFLFFY